jgi:hypothetical protein
MSNECKICNKEYSSYQSLWIHNKKFHNTLKDESIHKVPDGIHKVDITNKTYKCINCNKEYNNKWNQEKSRSTLAC